MLSVQDHDELKAVVLAWKRASKDIKLRIRKQTREVANPVWKSAVADHLSGRGALTGALLSPGVRVAPGNPPQALAARSTRKVGRTKRLTPSQDYYMAEFGVNPMKKTTYERKNRKTGGTHTVHDRRVNKGKPRRYENGRVVYPAFADIAPRMVSLWVQTVVRVFSDAAEGRETS